MKLYDFDGMFDEKLADYIAKNSDKYKEEEWEEIIPRLYAKFGDTVIKSIGKTPNEFYAELSDGDLVAALCAHLKKGIPVSEFLCNAIETRNCTSLLVPLLDGSEDEIGYAMNLLASDSAALDKYMDMLADPQTPQDRKDTCVDYIKEKADEVKERALGYYGRGVEKEYMLEILSRCVLKDENIFRILLNEFRTDSENLPMHASYLAAYGDERALPYLLERIDDEHIGYIDFRELKYAIEALGGEYDKVRDFSSDPYYQLVKSHSADATDIFSEFKQ